MTNPGSASKNVLNSDVELKGSLRFSGELTFEGKLEGDINSEGNLLLGDTTVVHGNITAGSVVVRGKVNGNISAKDKIEIKSKTELFGDLRTPRLTIEEGVTFVGKSEVNPNKIAPVSAQSKSADSPRSVEPPRPGELPRALSR